VKTPVVDGLKLTATLPEQDLKKVLAFAQQLIASRKYAHHRTASPSSSAPRTISPMKRCSTTIAPGLLYRSLEMCS
jgi:hypothetical protein